MATGIEGRRVVVTGAAGGIGAGVVRGLAAQGAKIAAVYNRTEAPADLKRLARWYRCDLARQAEVQATFNTIAGDLGGVDALVAVAGLWQASPMESVDDAQIDYLVGVNFKSAVYTNQAAFALMKERGGRIINFGSIEGVEGNGISPVYASMKAAVHTWTRSAAQTWGKYGITVNTLAPAMHTKPYDRIRAGMTEEQRAQLDIYLASRIPIGGKMGDPEKDCAPVLAFLVSDASHFITGQLIPVDGGFMMLGA